MKHYSSGMYLRLAFAVAAHLEPEILLVDEVLAVGDASFQKRCLGKMNDVAREGRTVIFVSHNLQAIQRLCSHAVMLEAGQVAAFGDTSTVVGQYLSRDYLRPAPGARIDVSTLPRTGTGAARFVSVWYTNGSGVESGNAYPDGPLEFVLEIESDAPRDVRSLSVFLLEQYGTKVLNADTLHLDRTVSLRQGRNRLRLRIASIHLLPGTYRVGLWLADPVQAQSVTRRLRLRRVGLRNRGGGTRAQPYRPGPARSSPATSRSRSCPDAPWAQGAKPRPPPGHVRAGGVGGLASLVRQKLVDLHGDSTRGLRVHRAPGHGVRRPPASAARQGHTPARPARTSNTDRTSSSSSPSCAMARCTFGRSWITTGRSASGTVCFSTTAPPTTPSTGSAPTPA